MTTRTRSHAGPRIYPWFGPCMLALALATTALVADRREAPAVQA